MRERKERIGGGERERERDEIETETATETKARETEREREVKAGGRETAGERKSVQCVNPHNRGGNDSPGSTRAPDSLPILL